MKIHPGCGFPTALVAKFIAICDLAFGLAGIFWFVWILDGYGLLMKDPSIFGVSTTTPPLITTPSIPPLQIATATNHTVLNPVTSPVVHESIISITTNGIMIHGQSCNIVISGFYTIVNLVAFVLLLSAAHERNILKLKIWFGIRLTIFTFKCFLYTTYIIVGAPLFEHIPHIIFMAIHLYGLWVVWVFIKEIQEERRQVTENQSSNENAYVNSAVDDEKR